MIPRFYLTIVLGAAASHEIKRPETGFFGLCYAPPPPPLYATIRGDKRAFRTRI
jgi:hypothetical protein